MVPGCLEVVNGYDRDAFSADAYYITPPPRRYVEIAAVLVTADATADRLRGSNAPK